jgi:hypothetical protein
MDHERPAASGLEKLVDKYRDQFRIAENLNHYHEKDLPRVEKQYVNYCLTTGQCR